MLVLLPPSEGKTPRQRGQPVRLDALSFPELTAARERLLTALADASAGETAAGVLGVSPTLRAEISRNVSWRSGSRRSTRVCSTTRSGWRRSRSVRGAGQLVVDCRSAAYAAAWRPTREVAARTVAVRVLRDVAGSRVVVSHLAKHARGLVVRHLMSRSGPDPRTPERLAAVLG